VLTKTALQPADLGPTSYNARRRAGRCWDMTTQQHHRPTDSQLRAELQESAYLQYFSDVCERRDRAICNPVSTFEAVGVDLDGRHVANGSQSNLVVTSGAASPRLPST
jgi:hypothetical protein